MNLHTGTSIGASRSITFAEVTRQQSQTEHHSASRVRQQSTEFQVIWNGPPYSAAEGSTASVTVGLSAAPGRTVVIPLTTTNQDGASSGDYSGVPASCDLQQRRHLTKSFDVHRGR